MSSSSPEFKSFLRKCKKIGKSLGSSNNCLSGDKVYQDDVIRITLNTENNEIEIERKENNNPVVATDKNGRVFRFHGEWIHLKNHVNDLTSKKSKARQSAHPLQPLILNEHGTVRFKANEIVRYLLDHGGLDMNKLAILPFKAEDREQFAQLIGYSLSGFSELSYVSDSAYERAYRNASPEVKKVLEG